MYQVLIVDDEPMICKGLQSLLDNSGLNIKTVFTAHNGYEALDYLRMEDIDLLVTDIQMDAMNGIELMQQAKIMKPWVQTVVISAFEDFHYAQLAIRLGAKDYLVKPLHSEHFLDVVRDVLLKLDKKVPTPEEFISTLQEGFAMKELKLECVQLLLDILTRQNDVPLIEEQLHRMSDEFNISLKGPYYSIIKLKLLHTQDEERQLTDIDEHLFRYAALNIVYESLDADWNHVSFQQPNHELVVILQWSEEDYADARVNKIGQLELIGRTLHASIEKYLNIGCLVGISQILKGAEFLAVLHEQAEKAILWNEAHHDNYVFYYGDLNWSIYDEEPTADELHEQVHIIVKKAKDYIHENYHQKGLTLNEVAQKNHVSPNYLSYLFKKYTGYNLWEYVIKLRMEESKRLLMTTDMRRYEIADRVGYESPEHFSKIFKKYYGKSLSEMKK